MHGTGTECRKAAGFEGDRAPAPPADMHCHLSFAQHGADIARQAGWPMLSMTVDPREFARDREALSPAGNVHVAAGLHPWWVSDGTCGPGEVALLEELVETTRFVGEVGLDFARRHAGTEDAQVAALERVVARCTRLGGKLLSIHALRSAGAVLDVLERHGATRECTCILHWFSGSGDELLRAIRLGCLFSVNDRMLATGRGREYVKAMPLDRLLLETDLPSRAGETCSAEAMAASLLSTLELIEAARREPCREAIERTGARVLGER